MDKLKIAKPAADRPRGGGDAPPTPGVEATDPLRIAEGGLAYALDHGPRPGKKVVITVRRGDDDATPFVDEVRLLEFKTRERLARAVGEHFRVDSGAVLGHLARLIDQAERASTFADAPGPVVLDAARRRRAEKLLSAPDLLDRAAAAVEALGYVGEQANKRLVYLVATSRLLVHPLSALLLAPSGAGKSELLDKVSLLLPPEAVEYLSRLTPTALYYAGPDRLRHKLVIVDEQTGASEADYSIRTLQTKGFLRLAVSVKGHTENVEAHGPIALLSGTTRSDLDPENLSRCLELSLDDSPEQTRRIQQAQRRAWSGQSVDRVALEAWQDAQRLLDAVGVVIPFAPRLDFPCRTTKDRREHQKLLTLVAAHALLHQRQRARDEGGQVVATPGDYRAIHGLLLPHLERTIDGLSPRAARAFEALSAAEGPLTRHEVAALAGWNYMTALRALEELVEQELVGLAQRLRPRRYQLLGSAAILGGVRLTSPDDLEARRRPARKLAPVHRTSQAIHARDVARNARPGRDSGAKPTTNEQARP